MRPTSVQRRRRPALYQTCVTGRANWHSRWCVRVAVLCYRRFRPGSLRRSTCAREFDAGNLLAVAKDCISGPHIIASDNDQQRERELDASGKPKPNVGKLAAIAAAEAVCRITVLPEFAADKPTLSDWNDKVAAVGIDEPAHSSGAQCRWRSASSKTVGDARLRCPQGCVR
jgi:hypothetical protein